MVGLGDACRNCYWIFGVAEVYIYGRWINNCLFLDCFCFLFLKYFSILFYEDDKLYIILVVSYFFEGD